MDQLDKALASVAALINGSDGFTVVAHISPDGDTLGSSLALGQLLRSAGKRAEIVCDGSVPQTYAFLPGAEGFMTPDAANGFDNVIAVDCADEERLGAALPLFKKAVHTAVIDHHPSNVGFGEVNAIEPQAAATGELIYRLAALITGASVDAAIATCLYTAIVTDTGNFAYSNTAPSTFMIAAHLLEHGIDSSAINRRIYRSIPYQKQKLMGLAVSRMRLFGGGSVGYTFVTLADMRALGACEADTDGIVEQVRDVDSVEVAVMMRESSDGSYKVSLRSKEYADVGSIAKALGGGGHKFAAGCTLHGTLEENEKEIIGRALALTVR